MCKDRSSGFLTLAIKNCLGSKQSEFQNAVRNSSLINDSINLIGDDVKLLDIQPQHFSMTSILISDILYTPNPFL